MELTRFFDWVRRTFAGAHDVARRGYDRALNIEERVDRWFQIYATLVVAVLGITFVFSWNKVLTPGVVLGENLLLLAAAFYVAVFRVKWTLRVFAGATIARHLGGVAARGEHLMRMGAVRVLAVGAMGIALGWALFLFPVRDTTAAALWATATVAAIIAIVAPPKSEGGTEKARKAFFILAGILAFAAVIFSAATVEDSPVHGAAVAVSDHFEGETTVVYITPTVPPTPPAIPAGYVLVDWMSVQVDRDYGTYWSLAWMEGVEWWIDAPTCVAGVVRIDSAGGFSREIPVTDTPARITSDGPHRFRMKGSGNGCQTINYFAVVPAG